VRAMTIAPARQLTLDIPRPGRDRGRVWDQMPDAARTRVPRLLAAMIAAGVLAGDDGCQDADSSREAVQSAKGKLPGAKIGAKLTPRPALRAVRAPASPESVASHQDERAYASRPRRFS
jgi:hypothetical protein